jgi:myo-inositol 2-dehydrogenase/D-chiro-inositol 1-dehydrogenase
MELAGTLGTRAVGLGERAPLTGFEGPWPAREPWPDFVARFHSAYVAELDAFLRAARGEKESPCPIEDALAALFIAEAAELSRREARSVRVTEVIR